MQKIEFKQPKDYDLCLNEHAQSLKDPKTPYYCRALNDIRDGEKAQRELPNAERDSQPIVGKIRQRIAYGKEIRAAFNENQYQHIQNLCDHLESSKKYCDSIFNKNFWKKIVEGLEDAKHIKYFCRELLATNEIKKDQLEICATQLSKQNDYCHFSNKKYPALTPKPDCNSIALAMNKSRLYSDLKDCPAYMGNQAVLNIARILEHFKESKQAEFDKFCYIKPSNTFLDYNLEADNEKAWQIYLCFNDPIEKDETCLASLLGNHPSSKYSLEKVLVRILAKTRGASLNTTCEMTPTAVYNADRLKYNSGCHILYDIKLCNATDCPMEFLYNGVSIKNIQIKNKIEIDYFENTQQKSNFAQINLLEKELSRKNREVRNLSILRLMLKQNSKAIIHGVGCAEDILPHFFQKNSLNQCRPLPFIIDGTIENDDKVSLIVRTAIDDIQAPRIIDWNYIFNAIKQYSEYHPRKIWSLHVIY